MSSSAASGATFESVDALVAHARRSLDRLDVEQAEAALAAGARLVDIRPAWQRANEGEIVGSLIVERNHLEWRLHPRSSARLACAVEGQRWIVVCSEGYTSSLAAAALVSLGVPATDLIGGVHAWAASGRALVSGPTAVEQTVGVVAVDPVTVDAVTRNGPGQPIPVHAGAQVSPHSSAG